MVLNAASDDPLLVKGDAVRLSQVLLNVLQNACKFTAPQGVITLTVRRNGPWAEVQFDDDGIGFARDARERIFGMFSQEAKSGVGGNQGLGIGLAVARQLARLHGGDIVADSPGPGRGATFILRLPLTQANSPMRAVQGFDLSAGAGSTVLIVDDNVDACEMTAHLLESSGYRSRCAYTAAGGLAAFADVMPDVALLDIGLPDFDGYELCRQLRSQVGAGVILIAITGWGQQEDRMAAREAGFDAHLTKPVDPLELEQTLATLLSARRTLA